MSTIDTADAGLAAGYQPARTHAPTFPRLLLAETRRLLARRFTRILLLLAVGGFAIGVIYLFSTYARPDAADLAQATAQRDQSIAQMQADYDACTGRGDTDCYPAPSPADFRIDQFVQAKAIAPLDIENLTLAVGIAVAMAGFVLAATFIGAEWSSRNIVSWLFWEPRRLRLLGAKLLAVIGVIAVLSFLAQLIWWPTSHLLLSTRGDSLDSLGPDAIGFWTRIAGAQFRAGLLAIPLGILGFALANLIRNTAASLGIAFVFLVVVESVMRGIAPGLQPFQISTSAAALITPRGIDVFGALVYDQKVGGMTPELIHVSNGQGAAVLAAYALIALLISTLTFTRRDIT